MRKKLATKICAIAMTAAMVASLAGCGNNDGSNSSEGGNSGGNVNNSDAGGNSSDEGNSGGEEEVKYDFGGKTIRVSQGIWSDLDEENKTTVDDAGVESIKPAYITARDLADQLEAKYNIKIEYVKLDTTGYDTDEAIQTGCLNGECFADIFTVDDQVTVSLTDYIAVVPEPDKLQWGSIYLEPATWGGTVYGFTYDNMGSTYAMVYSREYLVNIGMATKDAEGNYHNTPTEKFLAGEWDYEAFKQYLTELKAKLPSGTYPISVHPFHWAAMAPAANGVVSVDSDMKIHLTDEAYVDAMEFYKELAELGLAAPLGSTYTVDGGGIGYNDGDGVVYSLGDMCTATEAKNHVITMAEAWQMPDLYTNLSGDWGIVPWPWSSKHVSCSGDYTTLSENYRVAQAIWTNMVVAKQEYRAKGQAADISDMDLFLIARDWCDLKNTNGSKVRYAAWEAEKNGTEYVNLGYDPGKIGNFATTEDAALYDWLHSRVIVDWGHSMNGNAVVRVNRSAMYAIPGGYNARTAGETWQAEGETNIKDRWGE